MVIEIDSIQDLQDINKDLTADYVITKDIDATGFAWVPIGDYDNRFEGSLDGNFHTISNLTNNYTAGNYDGLFGAVGVSGVIRNLNMRDFDLTGQTDVGAICGFNFGTIENCSFVGKITATASNADAGGICAVNNTTSAMIRNCWCDVTVSGVSGAGGIAGHNNFGHIENCHSYGRASASKTNGAGGIAGRTDVYPQLYFTDDYWDYEASGNNVSAGEGNGVTKETTSAMHQQATFVNWDFNRTWYIREGIEYPKLRDTMKDKLLELTKSELFLLPSTDILRLSTDKVEFLKSFYLNYINGQNYVFTDSKVDALSGEKKIFKPLGSIDSDLVATQLIKSAPVYNSASRHWELQDYIGNRQGVVQESRCYKFDGSDDYIDWGFKPENGLEYWEVEMSFKRHGSKSISFLNSDDDTKEWLGFLWYHSDNKIRVYVSDGTNLYYNTSTNAITSYDDQYITLKIIYDNSQTGADKTRVWINGTAISMNDSGNIGVYGGTATANYITGKYVSAYYDYPISDIIMRDSDGKILHEWHCDEGSGEISYDSIASWFGDDRVTNGSFDSDVSGWSTIRASITWNSSGYAEVTQNSGSDNSFAISQASVIDKDGVFDITFRAKSDDISDSAPALDGYYYNDIIYYLRPNLTSEWQDYHFRFKYKITTSMVIHMVPINVPDGTTVDIDNIVVKKYNQSQNGTLMNIDATTFHTTDNNFESPQNTTGYNDTWRHWDGAVGTSLQTDITQTDIHNWGDVEVEVECTFEDLSDLSNAITLGGNNCVLGLHKNEFILAIDSYGRLAAEIYDGTSIIASYSTFYPEINKKYTINFTIGSRGMNIWVDGVKYTDNTDTRIPRAFASSYLYYGYNGDSSNNSQIKGTVYSVKIWNGYKDSGTLVADWDGSNGNLLDTVRANTLTNNGTTYGDIYLPIALDEDGNSTGLDNFGSTPTYTGLVKRNMHIINTNVPNFDGTDDFILFYANAVFKPQSKFSFSLWFKSNETTLQSHDQMFRLFVDNNNRFYVSNPGGSYEVINGTAKGLSQINKFDQAWHHYVFVADGTTYKQYVDGELFSTDTSVLDLSGMVGNPKLYIGGSGTTSYAFNGNLSDVKIWNGKALTATDVDNDYNGISVSGLTSLIPLQEGDGTRVYETMNRLTGYVANTDATFWSTDDNMRPYNMQEGFDQTLYCASDGVAYGTQTIAYGTFEFDIYASTSKHTHFIANNASAYPNSNGYFIYVSTSGALYLYMDNGSGNILMSTATGYLSGGMYRLRIIRDTSGKFTVYIKGDIFSWDSWTLVDVTGGSGTNPVTDNTYSTSTYYVTDYYANGSLSNFTIDSVPIDILSATTSSGTFYGYRRPISVNPAITVSNPAGKGHNDSEHKLVQYKQHALWDLDKGINYFYTSDTDDTPLELSFSDKSYDVNTAHKIFSDAGSILWYKILSYAVAQADENLFKIEEYINKP